MVVFVADYLKITNDNNNVIIDDSYNTPMLIYKGVIPTNIDNSFNVNTNIYSYWVFEYWRPNWTGYIDIKYVKDPAELGFVSSSWGPPQLAEIEKSLIVGVKSLSGDIAVKGTAILIRRQEEDGTYAYILRVRTYSDVQNANVEIVVYSAWELKSKNLGFSIYNETGKLIYDVMRPPMHYIGSMYGNVNAANTIAATYDMGMPPNIDSRYCYLTCKSATPYYAAYRIHAGGVSWADTTYKAVLSFPSPSSARVQLVRVNTVAGNNSSYSRNLYFENLIYCPYPNGVYI